jgi:translocation and assembly module TamA
MQIDASAYQPLGTRIVFAGRVRFGSIEGVSRDSIAPSRRFYAGGGGSIRGFGYQKIGPVDQNGDPLGGKALTEFSAEARIRFGSFGVVPFLDGGNLYSGSLPKLTGLRYGTGLGVRYYSSFGPIRVDVGTPLRRRPGESRVAVYVSLGQAF